MIYDITKQPDDVDDDDDPDDPDDTSVTKINKITKRLNEMTERLNEMTEHLNEMDDKNKLQQKKVDDISNRVDGLQNVLETSFKTVSEKLQVTNNSNDSSSSNNSDNYFCDCKFCNITAQKKCINKMDDVSIFSIQQWDGWTAIDKCKVCNGGPFCSTYEVNWDIVHTKEQKYCSEMCIGCLRNMAKQDPEIQSDEYRKTHPKTDMIAKKYGLLN